VSAELERLKLRHRAAEAALGGLLAHMGPGYGAEHAARLAVVHADALLDELAKPVDPTWPRR
jgi:hypothetical protein